MRQLEERLHRLEMVQESPPRGKRWEQRRASRSYTYYSNQEEDEEWRLHHLEDRGHPHQPPKPSFPFIKLPSFNGESDHNVYLGWEAKV